MESHIKVLSYLELVQCTNDDYDAKWDKWIWDRKIESVKKFYSQKFTPELIIALFEGWKRDKWYEQAISEGSFSVINDEELRITIDKNDNIEYGNVECLHNIPRTLDDFINDTSRSGITLEWKA
jgi:hypothetical protein